MKFTGKLWMAAGIVCAVLVMGAPPTQAAGIDAALLASNCVVCHGPKGRSLGEMPKLKGMSAEKILDSFRQFRAGQKASTIMDRISKGYTDDQVRAIARHLGAK
ncbi:MAG: c-type cytochrome [Rhodospirillales bacterium]|nr:c-type cytochrome [Rhodospirillales bacterium]